jgi:rubredoxin
MSDLERDLPASPEDLPPTAEKKPGLVAADDDLFECRACGYVYNPNKGDTKNGVIAGTPFTALPTIWKCPTCGAKKVAFINIGSIGSQASGFKANMGYGFGVNTMTAEQKSLLIFGSLALGALILISLYSLN